ALVERLRFESLLLALSAAFVKARSSEVDALIQTWLGTLARHLEVERCTLWEFSADGKTLHRRHYFFEDGDHPGGPGQDIPTTRFSWLTEQASRGKILAWVRIPEDIPIEAAEERRYSVQMGMKAVLSIPVLSESSLFVMVLGTRHERTAWPEALIQRLQLVA